VLYVAPEQLRGDPATARSDQYALACAVFHTLAGHPPFERETRSKLYGAHLLTPAPALQPQDSVGAPTTRAALLRAMSKAPEERYATCGALIHEALPVDPPKPARFTRPGRGRRGGSRRVVGAGGRRSWWPFAVVVVAAVDVGAVVWTAVRPDGTATSAPSVARATRPAETRPVADPRMTAASTARRIAWDVPITSRPVRHIEVLDDSIVVSDDRGTVVADTADGAVRWRRDAGGSTGSAPPGSGPPTLDVAADGDLVVHGGAALSAVDTADGDPAWTADDVGPVLALALADRAVVAATGDPAAPGITAVDRADGTPLWRIESEPQRAGEDVLLAAGADVVYALAGDELTAVEVPATADRPGRPAWRKQVASWPVLASVGEAVIVAGGDGRVCRYAAGDGAVLWCEAVPGVEAAAPRLYADGETVVVATPEVVVGLDARSGHQAWSVSPGSPTNQVVVGSSRVVIADRTGLRVIELETGDVALELPDLGNVTALAVGESLLYVGSAEGSLMALDLGNGS